MPLPTVRTFEVLLGEAAPFAGIGEIDIRPLLDLIVSIKVFGSICIRAGVTAQAGLGVSPEKLLNFTDDGLKFATTPDAENNRIVIDHAGVYLVQFNVAYDGEKNKTNRFEIRKTGLPPSGFDAVEMQTGVQSDILSGGATSTLLMAPGEAIEVFVSTPNGGATVEVKEAQLFTYRIA